MDNNQLKNFVLEASQSTYASEDKDMRVKQEDDSTTIVYENGNWKYQDNYFGGEPYGGREVVFYKGKPVWMMVYYGWVIDGQDPEVVYGMLTKALRNSSLEMPYRGPKSLIEGNLKYINELNGSIENFSGEERIYNRDTLLYTAKYMGGLINKG